jgi:hypothetical protein
MILVLGGRGVLYSSVWRGKRPPACFCSRAKERTRGISGSRCRWWVISKRTSSTRSHKSTGGKSRVVTEVTLGCLFGAGEGDPVGIESSFLGAGHDQGSDRLVDTQ